MTIGIIGAMDEEISLLLSKMTDTKEETIANNLFVEGMLFGKEIVLLKSGIGKVNAAMGATIMHERYAPSHVINTGSAGGFAENLKVGDVVISTEVVYHDVDVTAFSYAYGQVPKLPETFKADSVLIDRATESIQNLDIGYEKGLIATGDTFMQEENHVAFVRNKFPHMLASEMEAGAIAQVCHQYGTPFVVIRSLSDIAGKDSSVSFDEFLDQAAKNAAQLIMDTIQKI
jgi:adenosylhomocysteine nucleosidase